MRRNIHVRSVQSGIGFVMRETRINIFHCGIARLDGLGCLLFLPFEFHALQCILQYLLETEYVIWCVWRISNGKLFSYTGEQRNPCNWGMRRLYEVRLYFVRIFAFIRECTFWLVLKTNSAFPNELIQYVFGLNDLT